MKKLLVTLVLLCTTALSMSQTMGHAENWYFGTRAGISFSTYPPEPIESGAMVQREGNATISDADGNLLFYTNGMQVWNKDHAVMKNGSGLSGQHTAAQSSVIVPDPSDQNTYYIFTISDWQNGSGKLCYSTVDISLESGKGSVTQKNTLLNSKCREQIAAVYANKEREVWVLTHEKGNKNFVAYLVSVDKGVETTPVVSTLGIDYVGKNRYGQLKFSSNGKRLCATLGGGNNSVQLFNFDQKTGKVSSPIELNTGKHMTHAYSSEFSPSGRYLYVVAFNGDYIYQFDLQSDDESTIQSSRTEIAGAPGIKSCLQIGHDQKIYVSRDNAGYMGVIHEPDLAGALCKYENDAIKLKEGTNCRLGFPNFIQSYFEFYRELEGEAEEELEFIIHFDSNSSKVNEASRKVLDEIAKILNDNPEYTVEIASHTDCVGKAGQNKKLSKKRAQSTDNYIQAQIGDKKRSSAKGFGESAPLTNCECAECSSEENARNRRTTIKIIK